MLNIDEIKKKIFNAKSNELLKEFPDCCIDLVVTSPPYDDLRDYENKSAWNFDVFKEIAQELYRVVKLGGIVVWVIGD
jgi:site-specific DNA-methyltransferase (adenine-specific)